MKHSALFSLAIPFLFAACGGGGSSVPGSTRLADLTLEQSQDLCRDFAADHPLETFTCPGDTEPTTRGVDPADCEGADAQIDVPDTCTATVSQLVSCENKLDSMSQDEFCNLTSIPSECAFFLDASCQQPQAARTSSADVVSLLRHAVVR